MATGSNPLLTEDILKGRKLEELSTHELLRLEAKNKLVLEEKIKALPQTPEEIEQYFEDNPLTATKWPEEGKESDAWKALKAIIKECMPEERLQVCKEDGNNHYTTALKSRSKSKRKKGLDDAWLSYSEGIAIKEELDEARDEEVEQEGKQQKDDEIARLSSAFSVLHSNRAAVELVLGNAGKAYRDCLQAIHFDSQNFKAYYRAAQAYKKVDRLQDAMTMVDSGLLAAAGATEKVNGEGQASPDSKKMDTKGKENEKRISGNKVTASAQETAKQITALKALRQELAACLDKIEAAEKKLLEQKAVDYLLQTEIARRKIKFREPPSLDLSHYPMGGRPFLDDEGELRWPVLFKYPEAMQTDFVPDFVEASTFRDQLSIMFPPAGPAPEWDKHARYNLDLPYIKIFYEVRDETKPGVVKRRQVKLDSSLGEALKRKDHVVDSLPQFIITAD
eukprot:gb/GEZN01005651.1/.p1 GENE.gb/GEZN01005651.1/~~gb/GEZN01005651.1/.p1  ORF type:complete len:450 (-),score=96.46 gb/GEZN01005651.1/:308-1657(-)